MKRAAFTLKDSPASAGPDVHPTAREVQTDRADFAREDDVVLSGGFRLKHRSRAIALMSWAPAFPWKARRARKCRVELRAGGERSGLCLKRPLLNAAYSIKKRLRLFIFPHQMRIMGTRTVGAPGRGAEKSGPVHFRRKLFWAGQVARASAVEWSD